MDKSLLKALHLLEALALSDEPRGITELANELGMTKSNVHRYLQTFAHRGFVEQDADQVRYRCTLKMWELGSLIADRIEIKGVARPYMMKLAEQTQETVHLSILDGGEVLYIDKIDSPQPVRAYSKIGGRAPAYCVATGKAMLALLTEPEVTRLCGELVRHSPRTITDPADLRRELDKVREQGYAVNRGEWRASVSGIGAPVLNAAREVCAAIGISGPIERLTPGVVRDFAPLVVDTARSLSMALGYTGPMPGKAIV